MARQARLVVPGQLHHLIQRGHNRQAIFTDDADREAYLRLLGECAHHHGVALHAYVLMDNHVHALVTPRDADSLSLCWQSLGRRYVAGFNQRRQRSGTLWEGRFKLNLVEAESWLLACQRYIELNPARTGHAIVLTDLRWSSAAHHLGLRRDPLVTDHPAFWRLGNTPFEREAAYRRWLEDGVSAAEARRISDALNKGHALGSEAFLADMEQRTARSLRPARRGRPRKLEA